MAIFKGIEKNCEVCGKLFRAPKSRKNPRTCSNECGYKIRAKSNSIEKVAVTCACCGVVFQEHQCHAGRRRFCSRDCQHKDETFRVEKSAARVGESNPMWQGGLTVKTVSKTGRTYSRISPEKERAKAVAYIAANLDVVREKQAIYRGKNAEKMRAYSANWRASFPEKNNAKTAKRRAHKLKATPAWADPVLILAFYEEAQRLSIETGIVHHVDHMVPLQSKHVSGLHTHDNLCVMIGADNISKSNRHWPDKP